MAGKRVESEKLFAEGHEPGSPELDALGLKKDTVKRYFRDWKNKQSPPAEKTEAEAGFMVTITPAVAKADTVGSLQLRQLFDYQGFEYRVNQIFPDKIHVLLVEDAPAGGYKIEQKGMYLPPDTKVIPK